MNAQLVNSFMRGLSSSDLIPADEVRHWMTELRQDQESFQKAITLQTYSRELAELHSGPGKLRSILYVNELGVVGRGAEPWMEKPGNATGFDFLSYMHEALDVHQAIVQTRVHQVVPFLRPYDENDDTPTGYRWVRRDGEKLTPQDRKEVARLDRILGSCGNVLDPAERQWDWRRRSFTAWGAAKIADSLVYDSCPDELALGNDGRLLGWRNIDPRSFRLAYQDGYQGDDSIVGIQMRPEDRQAWTGYTKDDLVFEVRNPRSSIHYGDYGRAELESLIRVGTAYVNSFAFNSANQDRNSMPRGFLTLYGRFDKRALNSFRTQWNDLLRGAAKRWSLPVLVSENRQEGGATYTPVDVSTTEMYLTKWMIFLISVACALHGMDPVEINMEAFTAKQSSLSGKDTAEKLQSSHDRGLIPLMLWFGNVLNEQFVARLTTKYRLTWCGLFPADEERLHEIRKLVCTVDEGRAIIGDDPHENPMLGGAPLNPSLMSLYVMEQQQKMMQQQQPGPGMQGGPDSGGGHLQDYYSTDAGEDGGFGGGQAPSGGNAAMGAGPIAKSQLVVSIREVPA